MIIRKLRDNKKQKDVTVGDVPKSKFSSIEKVVYQDESYRRHRYKLYSYPVGTKLVDGDYVKDVNKFKGSFSDAPIQVYSREGSEIVVDRSYLVHQLAGLYGEGRLNVYKFGGQPPYESIFERKFIEVIR